MDPVTQAFLIEAAAYLAGAFACAWLGWIAARLRNRHEIRRAVDATHRAIENRLLREQQDRLL